jgi:hypothetical protein
MVAIAVVNGYLLDMLDAVLRVPMLLQCTSEINALVRSALLSASVGCV